MKRFVVCIFLLLISSAVFAGEPVKIPKSQVGPSFATEVSAYAAELADWRAHMDKVAADKAAGVPREIAHAPFPPPTAPAAVSAAIDETGAPNYVIVDDGPTPDQILAAKKAALSHEVDIAEAAEIEKVLPAAKARAMQFRAVDISASDVIAVQKAMKARDGEQQKLLDLSNQRDLLSGKIASENAGIVKSIVNAVTGPSAQRVADTNALAALDKQVSDQAQAVRQAEAVSSDRDALAAKTRAPADHAFMLDYLARKKTIEAVHRWAAQAQSDVADLTEANVDAWKITPFQN